MANVLSVFVFIIDDCIAELFVVLLFLLGPIEHFSAPLALLGHVDAVSLHLGDSKIYGVLGVFL